MKNLPGILILCVGFVLASCQTSGTTPSSIPVQPSNPPPTLPPTTAAAVPTAAFTPTLTVTPVPVDESSAQNPVSLGFDPVLTNSQWEPLIGTFDGVEMALVPVGCFQMGSADFGSEPVHEVCFEEPFWIDVTEVTRKQVQPGETGPQTNHPVEGIRWTNALAHCASRDARLPTEAEWEYAARGPDNLLYPWGSTFEPDYLVHAGNAGSSAEVKSKPEGISWVGAYDLSGNVSEWVYDWFGIYPSEQQINPQGPESGDIRITRGGGYYTYAGPAYSANRMQVEPDEYRGIGFRCARSY